MVLVEQRRRPQKAAATGHLESINVTFEGILDSAGIGARWLAMTRAFAAILEKEAGGGYDVFCPTLPACHTQSIENIRETIELYVESLVEDGLPISVEDILIKPIEIPA
jgi:predicted RNase H-like HicB family nuclease